MLVTASEGAAAHLGHLRTRGRDFDPMTRERFLAGALLPAAAYGAAQRLRTAWCRQVALALRDVDVLLAPAVPFPAPRLDEASVLVDGQPVQGRRTS
jgi:Asp-tRNA(Asn)/Glu-tRNA(Gln) amidotransferase A subunit family amidase